MNTQENTVPNHTSLSAGELWLIKCYRAIPEWLDTLSIEQKRRLAAMPRGHLGKVGLRAVSIFLTAKES